MKFWLHAVDMQKQIQLFGKQGDCLDLAFIECNNVRDMLGICIKCMLYIMHGEMNANILRSHELCQRIMTMEIIQVSINTSF